MFIFFFNDTATTEIYTLSLHDALPIWILPFEPYPVCGQRSHADAHPESVGTAGAEHVLALSGLAPPGGGGAVAPGAARHARAGVGSGPCAAERDHAGYRYYGANAVWEADGGAKEL